jgi:hypothetical protein
MGNKSESLIRKVDEEEEEGEFVVILIIPFIQNKEHPQLQNIIPPQFVTLNNVDVSMSFTIPSAECVY